MNVRLSSEKLVVFVLPGRILAVQHIASLGRAALLFSFLPAEWRVRLKALGTVSAYTLGAAIPLTDFVEMKTVTE